MPRYLASIIFSIIFWSFFVLSCALLFCVALVILVVTKPFDKNGFVLHLFTCFWGHLYFLANPLWSLRVEGRHRLPWRGPAVLVANHQSLGDILVLFGLYKPFKWVSKASVFTLPFLGWNMTLNRYVALIRGNRESIEKMMLDCEYWLDRGVPILLFPEGTRSEDGKLKAFKDGAFRLAIKKGCPLFPVVLSGTSDTLPKHGLLLNTRSDSLVRVLPSIDPARFHGDVGALRDHTHDVISRELAALKSAK